MRVITPEEMARVDSAAIEGEGIQGLVLMENAGEAVASGARSIRLCCGKDSLQYRLDESQGPSAGRPC